MVLLKPCCCPFWSFFERYLKIKLFSFNYIVFSTWVIFYDQRCSSILGHRESILHSLFIQSVFCILFTCVWRPVFFVPLVLVGHWRGSGVKHRDSAVAHIICIWSIKFFFGTMLSYFLKCSSFPVRNIIPYSPSSSCVFSLQQLWKSQQGFLIKKQIKNEE